MAIYDIRACCDSPPLLCRSSVGATNHCEWFHMSTTSYQNHQNKKLLLFSSGRKCFFDILSSFYAFISTYLKRRLFSFNIKLSSGLRIAWPWKKRSRTCSPKCTSNSSCFSNTKCSHLFLCDYYLIYFAASRRPRRWAVWWPTTRDCALKVIF